MSETFTEKLKLSKRDTGDLNWGQSANANLEVIDSYIQQSILRPPRTLLATLGSGAVGSNLAGNTNYFYKVTAINSAGETTEGKIPSVVEAQVTQPATPLPVILQWETVKGATGYKIYKSTISGQEKFLASVSGESTSTFTDDGNTATNPDISVPVLNTAYMSVSKIIPATGISVNPSHGVGEVQIGNLGVTGMRKLGESNPLIGDVNLEAGTGITLTQDGVNNKINISATAAGNWSLVTNLTNSTYGSTFTPDFTGLSLANHRSYMLMFELQVINNASTSNWIALRLNGTAPTTGQQYMLTDQQGTTQDDEGSTSGVAKIAKIYPTGGSAIEICGNIIITGRVNNGFPHALVFYSATNQSAVEQMHRGTGALRLNLGSGVDLTSLGLFGGADLNFTLYSRMSLYQAQ